MRKIIKIILMLVCVNLCCCNKKNQTVLIIGSHNLEIMIDDFEVCQSGQNIEISFDSIANEKIKTVKADRIQLKNESQEVEIFTFNILYSPKSDVSHQSPINPKGYLTTFKNGNRFSIDILSKNKLEILKVLDKEVVEKCNE
ncbi:hypothetical protein [Flavobacterium lacus]|nr:hypothetical protein [Flavobacterium lacus]